MLRKVDLRSNGDTEMKARSFPDSALNPEASTMGLHDMAGDGEAQAGAAGFAGTGGVYPVEALENSLLLCLGDSNTRVGDGDHDVAIRAGRRNLNFSAGGCVLQGVVQKILQDFLKSIGVPARRGQLLRQAHVEGK